MSLTLLIGQKVTPTRLLSNLRLLKLWFDSYRVDLSKSAAGHVKRVLVIFELAQCLVITDHHL